MKKMILLLTCLIIGMGWAIAQTTRVNGTVLDENGEPLVGVSVTVKGNATIGTYTNTGGVFSLDVPSSSTHLFFRYLGLKDKEVAIAPDMRVTMEASATALDEVIVVAYGTTKKSAFTGSASVIKSKDIAKLQTGNVSKALEGAAAGVQITSNSGQPGSSASVRIRGVGSINASTSPLYVVDGVPFQGNLNSLNSMDIESMTVLKDAAANSLYGSRASNGVILITTKKGASGKPRVTVEARYGTNERGISNYDVIDSSAEFYELTWEALRNRQHYNVGNSMTEANIYATNNLISQLGNYNNYNVPNNQVVGIDGKINPNASLRYREKWEDEMFKTGARQEYVSSVSGGDDKYNYYLSLGYLNDEGYVVNSNFDRITSRLRLEKEVNKWFKVGGSAAYVKQKSHYVTEDGTEGSNMFMIAQNMPPVYPVYLHDQQTGEIVKDAKGNNRYDFGDELGYARLVSAMANPIASQQIDKNENDWSIFDGNVFADFKAGDFKLHIAYSINDNNDLGNDYMNGLYGQFKEAGGIGYRYTERLAITQASEQLSWAKSFGEKHNVDILAAHENYAYKYNFLYGQKQKFLDPDQRELSGAINNPLTSSYQNEYKVESYLGRLQYDYENKYYLSASWRTDGSSKFHKDRRWGQFWSAGASWRLTQENFLKEKLDWINDLKLKASYGSQGNDQLSGVLPWADQYTVANNNDNISLVFNYKGNPLITWEKSNTFNVGIDYSLNKSKIYGSLEYFKKDTYDLLFSRPVPSSSGYSSYPDNIGDMTNKGIEFEVTGILVKNNDFEWNLSFNATWYENEITRLPPERMEDGITDGVFKLMVGKSRYEYYTKEYAGVDVANGAPLWYKDVLDDDENPTGERVTTSTYADASDYFQGSALPDFYGGFGTYLNYKGIDLSIQTSYQVGGKGYDNIYAWTMSGNDLGSNIHKDIRARWTPDHTDTDVPRIQTGLAGIGNGSASSRYFIDASYLNIRNVSLGYHLPKKTLNKIGIESIRIYAVADNVVFFSKRKGYDPRTSWSSASNLGQYAPVRAYSLGFNLEF